MLRHPRAKVVLEKSQPDEQTIGKSIGLHFHSDPFRGFLQERDALDRGPIRIRFVNRSVGRRLGFSPDKYERAARLRVTVEPMVRRRVNQRTLSDVDASTWSTEHGDSNAGLGFGRRSFPFEDPALCT
jgi:hypothetical protein